MSDLTDRLHSLWICLENFSFLLVELPPSDITPVANSSAANGHVDNKLDLIPNGGPSTMVPCGPETPLANGVANGHITPVHESPFIGYIIAMHRKMVRNAVSAVVCTRHRFLLET